MMLVRTVLGASSVHGIGIFAAEDIVAGQQIWVADERLDLYIEEASISALPQTAADFLRIYTYPSVLRPGYVELETDNGRFMNHSVAPNTDFKIPDRGFATRDISKGEELLCDYREFIEGFEGYEAA